MQTINILTNSLPEGLLQKIVQIMHFVFHDIGTNIQDLKIVEIHQRLNSLKVR